MDIWIAGVGEIPCRPSYENMDFREMLYRAAKQAYLEAGITPSEIDGVVSSGLDFYEGVSIADSYTPDQVGGRLKFNTLVTNDSLNAFIHGCMLLKTGHFKTLIVTAYSKASNILNYSEIVLNSFDPYIIRPLSIHHYTIAALDAQAYLYHTKSEPYIFSLVSVKNRKNALKNPSAAYPEDIPVESVEKSAVYAEPLKEGHVAKLCDYAAAVIITAEKSLGKVRVEAFAHASGNVATDLALREWGKALWAKNVADMLLKQNRLRKIDFVEISEPFAHTELMVLEALHLEEDTVKTLREGGFNVDGHLPVNPSGGCIGMGYPLNAAGLQRIIQSVKLLNEGKWNTCLTASPDGEVVDAGSAVILKAGV